MAGTVDNRRIAKNTLYLYLRMIISMGVALYTSRVIIRVLGIDDFGIYNIVGGVVVLFSFVSTSLKNSTQRFISYELGKDDHEGINKVLNVSLMCHLVFILLFVLLSVTLGLWFVTEKLNIPESRKYAAIVVYFVSILTFAVNIIQSPYQAVIIAHEKMSFYAFTSILDVSLKLFIVYVLVFSSHDKLIVYSFLVLIVTTVTWAVSAFYCYRFLRYNRPAIVRDKQLFAQFFGYSGWSMFSGSAYVVAQQGGNILINLFNSVAANGAFGIANQATNALYSFVSNFQVAFNPQIVKLYSAGNTKDLLVLLYRTSYFSYYIFLLIAVPILSQIDYFLCLWLGDVPEYASDFCRLLLVYFLVDSVEAPLWMLIGATGKMKGYSLWLGLLTMMNIPVAWLLLINGLSIYWVFIIRVLINIIIGIIRPFYVRRLVPAFSVKEYCRHSLIRPFLVTLLIAPFVIYISIYFSDIHPFLVAAFSFVLTMLLILLLGLNNEDRIILFSYVKSKLIH
jgi:O-antigen/teichoic acid export membrane protein